MISFRVNKYIDATTVQTTFDVGENFVPPLSPKGNYNLITWPTNDHDFSCGGSRFANNLWTPYEVGSYVPDDAVAMFNGQIYVQNAIAYTTEVPNYVARVWKNNNHQTSLGANIGVLGTFPRTMIISLSFQDYDVRPGDAYGVYMYASHRDAYIDQNRLHTWWEGKIIKAV